MDKYLGQISRQTWIGVAVAFVIGLFIGLVVLGWNLTPLEWTNASFAELRPDLQRDYMALAIQSFARTPNAELAAQRWGEVGSNAPSVLAELTANPQVYGLTAEEVSGFATAVNASGQPAAGGATPTAPAGGFPPLLLAVACILTLVLAGALVYLLLFRNRQPAMARGKAGGGSVAAGGAPQAVTSYPEGQEAPIAQYLTTYALGNDLYDDSFSIDSPSGEFLGECGVGISETIGVGDPKKVTAFEVWLFDKNDIQTVTKVVMSAHAFNEPNISQRLSSKGEPVLAEPGKRVVLETATLQLEARVVNMNYGQGALPQNSFFDQLTLELAIWPKGQ